MLSASPLFSSVQASPNDANASKITNKTPFGYTPAQIAAAYGFNQISFGAVHGNGAGQTIAIVDAYKDANITTDLQAFDTQFGLPNPPKFTKYIQSGATSNAGWAMETALDVEWAHAMAPAANILLVEANSSSLSSLLSAVDYARKQAGVSVVSMSWGAGEFSSEAAYDSYFTTPAGHSGVTFVASSGDGGAGTSWPSVSPNILSVGGTSLNLGAGGIYNGESTWSGSGGGSSVFESEPSFQNSVQTSGHRTNPDVSFDANPYTGFAVYDSIKYSGQSGWFEVGGTSAGAPQWASLIAIANQGRVLAGGNPLVSGQAAVYGLPTNAFHDIVSGSTGYSATAGYDWATGLGSPVANLVVAGLVGASPSVQNSAAPNTLQVASGTQSSSHNTQILGNRPEVSPADGFFTMSMSGSTAPIGSLVVSPAAAVLTMASADQRLSLETVATLTSSVTSGLPTIRFDAPAISGSPSVTYLDDVLTALPITNEFHNVGEPIPTTAHRAQVIQATATRGVPTDDADDSEDALDCRAADACFAKGGWMTEPIDTSSEAVATSNRDSGSTAWVAAFGMISAWGVRRRARSPKRVAAGA